MARDGVWDFTAGRQRQKDLQRMASETGQGGCWDGAWGNQLESCQGNILSFPRRGATLQVSPRARLELPVGSVSHRHGTALCHIGREFTLPQFPFRPSRRMPRWGAGLFNTSDTCCSPFFAKREQASGLETPAGNSV